MHKKEPNVQNSKMAQTQVSHAERDKPELWARCRAGTARGNPSQMNRFPQAASLCSGTLDHVNLLSISIAKKSKNSEWASIDMAELTGFLRRVWH